VPQRTADAPSDLLRRIGGASTSAGCAASRAALAARAGLSVRFLAQVESGEANISLLRLLEVAQALGLGLEALLGLAGAGGTPGAALPGGGDPDSVSREVERLLEPRTRAELAEVRDWLATRFGSPGGPLVALGDCVGLGRAAWPRRGSSACRSSSWMRWSNFAGPLDQIFELHGGAYGGSSARLSRAF
jgi:transcriptional regulator with XRE-family HTH domain